MLLKQPLLLIKKKDDKKNEKKEDQLKPIPVRNVLLDTININSTKIKIAVLALNACSTLIGLEPGIPANVERGIGCCNCSILLYR